MSHIEIQISLRKREPAGALSVELGEMVSDGLGAEPAELAQLLNEGALALRRTMEADTARSIALALRDAGADVALFDLERGGARFPIDAADSFRLLDGALGAATAPELAMSSPNSPSSPSAHSFTPEPTASAFSAPLSSTNQALELELPLEQSPAYLPRPEPRRCTKCQAPLGADGVCRRCERADARSPAQGPASTSTTPRPAGLSNTPGLRLAIGLAVAVGAGYLASQPYARHLERSVAELRHQADRDRYRLDPVVHEEVTRLDEEANRRAEGAFLRVSALWLAVAAVCFAFWLVATR